MNKEGQFIAEDKEIIQMWKEYFSELLNKEYTPATHDI